MTFSQKIKLEISSMNPKIKSCCIYSFLYGMTFPFNCSEGEYKIKSAFVKNAIDLNIKMTNALNKVEESYIVKKGELTIKSSIIRYSTIAEILKYILKCPHCFEHFLKGVFFTCGTVNSPEKSHRLELVFSNINNAIDLKNALLDKSLKFNTTVRNNKTVLYIKRSELIEDFLALMGANSSAFDMINSKINHEVRNVANRATNCDSANINKSLETSKKQIDAINDIIKLGAFNLLSKPLQEIAILRLNFPTASIQELANRLPDNISKSGVNHRLDRIIKFYNTLIKN